jgi:hypothetical protein
MISDSINELVILMSKMSKDEFEFWMSYFLELLENQNGVEALESVQGLIKNRMIIGGW